jgi:hypothetical protein
VGFLRYASSTAVIQRWNVPSTVHEHATTAPCREAACAFKLAAEACASVTKRPLRRKRRVATRARHLGLSVDGFGL